MDNTETQATILGTKDTGRRQITQATIHTPKTHAILSTRHRNKTNKTNNGQRHRQYYKTQDEETKQRHGNTDDTGNIKTRQRQATNKTKNGQPRDTGNIQHKTQDEDK